MTIFDGKGLDKMMIAMASTDKPLGSYPGCELLKDVPADSNPASDDSDADSLNEVRSAFFNSAAATPPAATPPIPSARLALLM